MSHVCTCFHLKSRLQDDRFIRVIPFISLPNGLSVQTPSMHTACPCPLPLVFVEIMQVTVTQIVMLIGNFSKKSVKLPYVISNFHGILQSKKAQVSEHQQNIVGKGIMERNRNPSFMVTSDYSATKSLHI